MSGLKSLRYLDYAIYGKVIVPLLMFGTKEWFQIDEDRDAGRCQIISIPRRNRREQHARASNHR